MKKKFSTFVKGIFITGLSVLFIFPVMAQRDKGGSLITQDQINKITNPPNTSLFMRPSSGECMP